MIQYESNKVHDYIRASAKGDKEAKKTIVESIDSRIRSDVIRLGRRVADTDRYYKKFINKKNIHFLNDNILDSFDIMQLILEIEKINKKKINPNKIGKDTFKNFDSILSLIK